MMTQLYPFRRLLVAVPAVALHVLFLCTSSDFARAVPVTIQGFVADLTGIPHDRPNIIISVRAVGSNQVIARVRANPESGAFTIPINPDAIPDADVRLSISASGTAFLNGQQAAVATNGNLFGLAGEIAAGLAERIPGTQSGISQFIVLVVPKAPSPDSSCIRAAYPSCTRPWAVPCYRYSYPW